MTLWYKKLLVFVAAAVVYLLGQYFRGMWFLNLYLTPFCRTYVENGRSYCNSPYINSLGWPLIMFGEVLAVVALILLLANARGFRTWLLFSIWYLPLAAALSLYISTIRLPLGATAELWGPIRFFGVLYALITAGIVLYARLRPREQRSVARSS